MALTDDGRLLALLATLGLAGAAVARSRGSRGAVRAGRSVVSPSPTSWSVLLANKSGTAWFTRLPTGKVAFAWPVVLGADPALDRSPYGRLGLLSFSRVPLVPPSGLQTWFGNLHEAQVTAAWFTKREAGLRADPKVLYEPNYAPGDGSRYELAVEYETVSREGPVSLVWQLAPFRRKVPHPGYTEYRAIVVDPRDLPWSPDYLGDKLGLDDAGAEAALAVLEANLGAGSKGVVRKARAAPQLPSRDRPIHFLGGKDWRYTAGPWTVEWTFEEEGEDGDYDAKNPKDTPVLRATVLREDAADSIASYATLTDARHATGEALDALSEDLLSEAVDFAQDTFRDKAMQQWTWRTKLETKGS